MVGVYFVCHRYYTFNDFQHPLLAHFISTTLTHEVCFFSTHTLSSSPQEKNSKKMGDLEKLIKGQKSRSAASVCARCFLYGA